MKIRNHLAINPYIRGFHRKLNLSWALVGRDVLILVACGILAGMLIGLGLIAIAWRG